LKLDDRHVDSATGLRQDGSGFDKLSRAQLRRSVLEANTKKMRRRDARKNFGIGHEMW
jgi:hypothetical protein